MELLIIIPRRNSVNFPFRKSAILAFRVPLWGVLESNQANRAYEARGQPLSSTPSFEPDAGFEPASPVYKTGTSPKMLVWQGAIGFLFPKDADPLL